MKGFSAMKFMPVTPMLVAILKDALKDSYNVINELERDITKYEAGSSVHNIVLEGIEYRYQQIAVIKDLIDRYEI